MANISLKGKVYTGKGEGKKFVALPWVEKQIREKVGFIPYQGTLNIRLNREGLANKKFLSKAQRLDVIPEKGFCKGILIKAKISNVDCAIIIPQIGGYPPDVVEVVASVFLRHKLHLADGSETAVIVAV